MSMRRQVILLWLLTTLCGLAETREWRSNDGRSIHGELVEVTSSSVKIKVRNGKVLTIPFEKIHSEDVTYAKKQGETLVAPWSGWPRELRMNLNEVKIKVDGERSTASKTYYITEHFELASEVKLGQQVMLDIGRIFELTYQLMEASPWGILASPEGGLFKAELYASRESYIRAGGPAWSGGVYIGKRKVFMVPVESLGIIKGQKGYKRDEDFSLETVIHEVVHMLMGDVISTMPIAVTEGVAEYLSKIPLRSGAFKPGSIKSVVKKYRNSDFDKLLGLTGASWSGEEKAPKQKPSPFDFIRQLQPIVNPHKLKDQYEASFFLVYHLMEQMDKEGITRIQQLFKSGSWRGAQYEKDREVYESDFTQYKEAMDAFLKLDGVTSYSDGRFQYPSNLTPPEPPEVPSSLSGGSLELQEVDLLYGSEGKSMFISNMKRSLEAEFR